MERLNIGVDGYNLAMSNGTGVATYGLQLANTIHEAGHMVTGVFGVPVPAGEANREVEFFDNCQRPIDPKKRIPKWQRRREFARSLVDAEALDVPLTAGVEKGAFAQRLPHMDRLVSSTNLFQRAEVFLRTRKRFMRLRMKNPPEIMHWTYPVPVVLEGARNVYTLHDLVPLKLPYATLDDKAYYRQVIEGCIAAASHICTVSEASRQDVMQLFGVPDATVTNTYQVAASSMSDQPEEEDARAVEGLFGLRHRGYFLYFGAIEPKKNIGRLIEAYLSMQTETPLVIVGGRAWQAEEELKLMPGNGAEGGTGTFVGHRGQTIIRMSYLPRAILAKLIRGARAVLFPSLYEGFGLPVLEAMQVGTPVLTSTTSSLPEIAGDAAVTVDPYAVPQIIEGMRRLDGDEAFRSNLAQRSLIQAQRFSSEAYKERLNGLYRSVMASQTARAR